MSDAFELARARLATHRATRALAAAEPHDRALAVEICALARDVCEDFTAAVDDFAAGCLEVHKLQHQLERTGHYACTSYAEARRTIYDRADVMATTYLHSLLLSHAFWPNHARVFQVFREHFCAAGPNGQVLEVPVGTGLYLAEFARRNPQWNARGIDLSVAAVELAARIARHRGAQVEVARGDVFELTGGYDRLICGELLEHVEDPDALLVRLRDLLAPGGRLFLTTAIWAASADHIYLFESAADVRRVLERRFAIAEEWVIPVEADASSDAERVPMSYACVLTAPGSSSLPDRAAAG
ncbi:MAG: class I SAM-dependent methyltransferase [Kofleriaceae bacterium]